MALPEERQGYLGNLAQKSSDELRELLRRQKNLAGNSKFIGCLPDKGERINQMIDKLEKALETRTNVDQTADLFQNMAIQSERSRSQRLKVKGQGDEDQDMELLRNLANRGTEKEIVDERTNAADMEEDVSYTNSYEKVMKKSSESSQPKGKFKPNRSLRTKEVRELPTRDVVTLTPTDRPETSSQSPSSTTSQSASRRTAKTLADSLSDPTQEVVLGRLHHRYDELLEEKLHTGESHCQSSKLLNIHDSIELQKTQQHHLEEIQARHAAEKLAQRLNVKMEIFNPEGSSLTSGRYRESAPDEDEPDSGDEDDLDYPE